MPLAFSKFARLEWALCHSSTAPMDVGAGFILKQSQKMDSLGSRCFSDWVKIPSGLFQGVGHSGQETRLLDLPGENQYLLAVVLKKPMT